MIPCGKYPTFVPEFPPTVGVTAELEKVTDFEDDCDCVPLVDEDTNWDPEGVIVPVTDVLNTAEETELDKGEALVTEIELVCCEAIADVVWDPVIMAEDCVLAPTMADVDEATGSP